MKKTTFIICSVVLLYGCNLLHTQSDEEKEKANEQKAISIVQNAKMQTEGGFAYANQTWLDMANDDVKDQPNSKHEWDAKRQIDSIYLVEFLDQSGWGRKWEVDIEQKTVKYINESEYLSRKYNLTTVDQSGSFEILNATENSLKKQNDYSSNKIFYVLKAEIKNNTDKTISKAELSSSLKLIFEDKTVEGKSSEWGNGFVSYISKQSPWKPGTRMSFILTTQGLDEIYLQYSPEYAIFQVSLKAEDPIGYTFEKDVLEINLNDEWDKLKNPSNNITSDNNDNSSSISNDVKSSIITLLKNYYKVIESKEYDKVANYYSDPVERYYSDYNIKPQQVVKNFYSYAEKYPIQQTTVDYNSLGISESPDGGYSLTYYMVFLLKKKTTDHYKQYELVMNLEMNNDLKIKSIYEAQNYMSTLDY